MRFVPRQPPRTFQVGPNGIRIKDCGDLVLDVDEQVTFVRRSGAQHDFAAKDWGYYVTPSVNHRLPLFGLRTAIVGNRTTKRLYIFVMEVGFEAQFNAYIEDEGLVVIQWLDEANPEELLDGTSWVSKS